MNDTWAVTKLCRLDTCKGAWVNGITADNKRNIYFTFDKSLWKVKLDENDKTPEILADLSNSILRGIVWNRGNLLYICDWMNHRILSYSIDTGIISSFAGNGSPGCVDGTLKLASFMSPSGISMDSNGDLLVTDTHVRKIHVVEGIVQTMAGCWNGKGSFQDGTADNACFKSPSGIVIAHNGAIYVADMFNHCIRQIKEGIVSTVAGCPCDPGFQDGMQSKFSFPNSLDVAANGTMLVCDRAKKLRRIEHNGEVTSFSLDDVQNPSCLYVVGSRTILVGGFKVLYLLKGYWKWERFLWIGHLKESSSYCWLAVVPREIINKIAYHLGK